MSALPVRTPAANICHLDMKPAKGGSPPRPRSATLSARAVSGIAPCRPRQVGRHQRSLVAAGEAQREQQASRGEEGESLHRRVGEQVKHAALRAVELPKVTAMPRPRSM